MILLTQSGYDPGRDILARCAAVSASVGAPAPVVHVLPAEAGGDAAFSERSAVRDMLLSVRSVYLLPGSHLRILLITFRNSYPSSAIPFSLVFSICLARVRSV